MATFPSQDWWNAFVDAINGSASYADAAAEWEGAVTLSIEAEPNKGVPETIWGWLDLWHGTCRSGAFVDEAAGRAAPYVVSAPYTRWKSVIRGELDPIKGMMQGKLKVKGDLPTLIREVKAASELVALAGTVPTEFVDE